MIRAGLQAFFRISPHFHVNFSFNNMSGDEKGVENSLDMSYNGEWGCAMTYPRPRYQLDRRACPRSGAQKE